FQSHLENIFNGSKQRITFSNDSQYYWNARVNVDSVKKVGQSYVEVKLKCMADPYKINKTDGTEVL
ncbi:MAG: hypothetical protein ACLSUR_16920, partial [Coprobacillus cateniformis]